MGETSLDVLLDLAARANNWPRGEPCLADGAEHSGAIRDLVASGYLVLHLRPEGMHVAFTRAALEVTAEWGIVVWDADRG